MEYHLDAKAALARARTHAALATVTALAPALFTVLALYKMDLLPKNYLVIVLGLLVALALARIIAGYTQLRAHLAAFRVTTSEEADDPITIKTKRGAYEIPRRCITRISEIAGSMGGLRVALTPGWDDESDPESSPRFVDIPRGGSAFGELRLFLDKLKPIEPIQRRSKYVRWGLMAAIVCGIFFLPFFIDDIFGKSKVLAVGLILVVWIGLRFLARR